MSWAEGVITMVANTVEAAAPWVTRSAPLFQLDAPEWARAQTLPNEADQPWYSKNRHWWGEHWGLPLYASAFYVVLIFGIKRIMKDRQPFDLKGPLFLWNLGLSVFSGLGFIYIAQSMFKHVSKVGIDADLCDFTTELETVWGYLFCLSKFPELVDTIFIVLRKKPLIFLHWYHHIMTLLYVWLTWIRQLPYGGHFAVMNYLVHFIMYGYYACGAKGIRLPEKLAMGITVMQLTQMVFGTCFVIHNYNNCANGNDFAILVAFIMYFSYFLLFAKLFAGRYFGGKKKRSSQSSRNKAKKEQ